MYQIIAILLALAGVAGTIVPMLPGTPLIVLGALIYGVGTGFIAITIWDLLILGLFSLIAEGVDYIFSMIGAKKFGATRMGLIGGMIGLFVGLFTLGPLGIPIGLFIGAIIAELITGRPLNQAIKVGIGSLIGKLGGMVFTFIISLVMAGWVLIKIFR